VKSSKKWAITKEAILEVIADPFNGEFALSPSRDGNNRIMYVGFTQSERLLEIGVEILPNNIRKVFHAKRATKNSIEKAKI
jgi:hypothetical protein